MRFTLVLASLATLALALPTNNTAVVEPDCAGCPPPPTFTEKDGVRQPSPVTGDRTIQCSITIQHDDLLTHRLRTIGMPHQQPDVLRAWERRDTAYLLCCNSGEYFPV